MKRLLALILAFSVNAYGAAVVPNIFATQPSGNVPASYLDVDFALVSNYNTFSNYLVDSGAANAYVVTFPAGTTGSLAAGLLINFKAGADNTGASTLAANGMTAKSITNYDASALAAGQIKAGAIVSVIYDGTQFKLAGQPGGVPPSFLTPQATNTVLGNATSGSAAPTALAVGSCSTASSALKWTTNTGFGCNTSITANTAATATTATNFNNGTSSSSGGTVTATTFSGALSGNASTATTAGTVTTAAQPNITSVGTLAADLLFTDATYDIGKSGATRPRDLFISRNATFTNQRISGNQLDEIVTNTDSGSLNFNFVGYQGGTTKFRNFFVYDGKNAAILSITGSTKDANFAGTISVGSNLLISSTAPTIASGFCATPSITANNTAAFKITTGGSCAGSSSGSITMPTAPNGWVCNPQYLSSPGTVQVVQTAFTTTSVSVANYTLATGVLTNLVTGTQILFQCTSF